MRTVNVKQTSTREPIPDRVRMTILGKSGKQPDENIDSDDNPTATEEELERNLVPYREAVATLRKEVANKKRELAAASS